MNKFPLMVYRPVKEAKLKLGDTPCQTLTVADEEELEIAAADGWLTAADVLKPKPKRGRPPKAE